MRHIVIASLCLAACSGPGADCEALLEAYADEDGDGFGAGEPESVCKLTGGQVDNARDCDDTDPEVFPGAEERCNGADDDCNGELDNGLDNKVFYTDADGDGYGALFPAQLACEAPGPGWVRNADDCDDTNGSVHPDADEVCNAGIDDDCDGLADDADDSTLPASLTAFYKDADADGYGTPTETERLCEGRTGFVTNDADCDDDDDTINPDGFEVCNRVDDDCDGRIDDADDDTDPSTMREFYADTDGDGFGDGASPILACEPIPGVASVNADDCDDTNDQTYPGQGERLCDAIDNDCNAATPDDRDQDGDGYTYCLGDCADTNPSINPSAAELPSDGVDQDCDGLEGCYEDQDGDGARTATWTEVADPNCSNAPHVPGTRPIDCDDTDATVSLDVGWYADPDGDGFGGGPQLAFQCLDPGGGLVPETPVLDCNNADPTINPGAADPCDDGIDQDCSGEDLCASCQSWLVTQPGAPDGVYTIEPFPGGSYDVWCDMTTDGGGWTLVASTNNTTLDDAGTSYYADLTTLTPIAGHSAVWNGLRTVTGPAGDIRFACKLNAVDPAFTVDLSFYDIGWYSEITTGTDSASCFSENNGVGEDFPPMRRDNLTGAVLLAGDSWGSGYLEGEDSCTDTSDFTVDFDDRGMDSNQSDGTDWGEDDGTKKCGTSGIAGGAWYIFAREP